MNVRGPLAGLSYIKEEYMKMGRVGWVCPEKIRVDTIKIQCIDV